jgi:hypothetical protein
MNPPKEGASSRARAKGSTDRVSRSQEYAPPPHSSCAEPKTQGSESRTRDPIYSINALFGDVLEASAICGHVLGLHASLSCFCGKLRLHPSGLCSEICCRRGRRLVWDYLAVFSPFRVCIAVLTTTWPVFVAFLLVKFLLTDSESELAVANSATQRLVSGMPAAVVEVIPKT